MTTPASALDLRRRILQLVARFPGIHVRELARLLDRSQAITDYHVNALADSALLRAQRMEGYLRLYPAGSDEPLDARDRQLLGLLRERRVLHIALFLLTQPDPCRHADISRGTGIGKSLVSFHLAKMTSGGLAEQRGDAYAVSRPDAVRRLLARHQPVPDLREEFADLWDSLYD